MDICSTRTMRGANCGTGHQMLRSTVIFSVRKTQSERSYGQAEHKYTEKHQPCGEIDAGKEKGPRQIMGI